MAAGWQSANDRKEHRPTVMPSNYLTRILTSRVYDLARETPLDFAANLSRRTGNRIWLKREDESPIFSFKLRGAFNRIAALSTEELARGVIASSAGNHAQGVALAARHLGARALIVMPVTTPPIKVNAVRALDAKVVLHGDNYDACFEHAQALAEEHAMVFVPPFDDPDVIAGQGTVGLEILRQHRGSLDAIFVPVGGGGLIAGVGAYVKSLYRHVRIIGVEPDDANAMFQSLAAGRRVRLNHVGSFADGVAVRQVGKETFRIARECVDEVVCVSNDEICAAIKDVFEDTRSVLEPSGALAIAGMKAWIERDGVRDRELVAIASGANMNFDRLRYVSERAEVGERREAILAVTIPERPGSFRRFCRLIGHRSVTEFNYRYADARSAHVYAGIEIHDVAELEALIGKLMDAGYETLDLTDNEMAKLHVRHLVGGHAPNADNEVVYRFEFPERPGALLNFLESMGQNWNISLFHYRNHGADFGRVLCGIQVPAGEKGAFNRFLRDLGYVYRDETDNPAYRLFLS